MHFIYIYFEINLEPYKNDSDLNKSLSEETSQDDPRAVVLSLEERTSDLRRGPEAVFRGLRFTPK